MTVDLSRRLAAEGLGTGFLLAAIVGSGITGERLAGGNVAIALLANSLATTAMLYALIDWFGPISGAHFNPLVTVMLAWRGDVPWSHVLGYTAIQTIGAIVGVAVANLMFGLDAFGWSHRLRTGAPQWLSEIVATLGLIGLIWVCSRTRRSAVPALVAAYIGAAYWFTASTSFANPAVTIARAMTDTFTGIRPADVPQFLISQAIGVGLAIAIFAWLMPVPKPARAEQDTAMIGPVSAQPRAP